MTAYCDVPRCDCTFVLEYALTGCQRSPDGESGTRFSGRPQGRVSGPVNCRPGPSVYRMVSAHFR